jgi:hypothetical protein
MKKVAPIVVAVQAALVSVLAVLVAKGKIPLGVPGEWEWQRVKVAPSVLGILMGLSAIAAYSAFVAAGFRAMARERGCRVGVWLAALVVASVGVQGVVQEAAPEGYGLSKWIFALHSPGSSGYYTVAKSQMGDARRFLADYPAWIERQDALHVGTHPPGLFLLARTILDVMEARPTAARAVCDLAPASAASAIRVFRESNGLTRPDAAALTLTGALTLLACASTVVPLYFLARASLPASASWAAAAFWPVVPSALMFQPAADTAFPFLSTTALTLACWAARSGSIRAAWLGLGSGLVMAVGMEFTLAFLPVGLVVAIVILTTPSRTVGNRIGLIAAIGLGFAAGTIAWWAATSANPPLIWWTNQKNHARFYVEYPRSYLAWVLENPVELAIGLGLPAMTWAVVGFTSSREVPRVAWATIAVLGFLTLSGKNLSEVARLWLPLMPPFLVAAGAGFARVGGGFWTLGASVGLIGLQALILETFIQVVYPV